MFSNTFPSGSYMWSLFQLDKPNTESFWRCVKDWATPESVGQSMAEPNKNIWSCELFSLVGSYKLSQTIIIAMSYFLPFYFKAKMCLGMILIKF